MKQNMMHDREVSGRRAGFSSVKSANNVTATKLITDNGNKIYTAAVYGKHFH